MANMSYCRFQNTANDLDDCWDKFDDFEDLSEDEAGARKRIIELAVLIAESYADEIGTHVEISVIESA